MKKVTFSLGAAALAIVGALSSAFTVAPRIGTPYTFYNTNVGVKSTLKADYIYRGSATTPSCAANVNSFCKAIWTQVAAPVLNQPPSATAAIHTATLGAYNGL